MHLSSFPEGWPGAGLVLVRLVAASGAILEGINALAEPPVRPLSVTIGLTAILVGATLLVGFLTPIVGGIAALGYSLKVISILLTTDANAHFQAFSMINLAAISIALVLLGPGVFSVDARLFGRREIIIPQRRGPPRL
jgi:uncharacterized membrane protein YphA (DoxX/SURF4 family)